MDSILWFFPLTCAASAAHLAQEIRTDFCRRFPLGEMPRSVFVAVNVVVCPWALTAYPAYLLGRTWGVLLEFVFSLMVQVNDLFHLGYMAIRRRYFPGGMTAGVSAPLGLMTMLFAARRLFSR